jgi:hypothetical protein
MRKTTIALSLLLLVIASGTCEAAQSPRQRAYCLPGFKYCLSVMHASRVVILVECHEGGLVHRGRDKRPS